MSPFRHLRYLAFRGLALPSFSPGPRREIKEGETADLTAMEATLNGVIETRREADISKGWTRADDGWTAGTDKKDAPTAEDWLGRARGQV